MATSTSPSPTALRALTAAVALLFAAGVIAAVADDGDQETATTAATTVADGARDDETGTTPDDTVVGTTAETQASGSGNATSTSAPEATSGTEPSTTTTAAPTTTIAPATTTAPGTGGEQPSGAAPTTAGTYRYDTDGTLTLGTAERDLPPVTSLVVSEPDGQNRQIQVRDLRDEAGDGTITRTTFRYGPEGVFLERLEVESSFSGFGQTSVLVATEPFLIIPAGAGPGTSSTGTLQGDGTTAQITLTIGEVGPEESTSTLVAELSGNIEGSQTSEQRVRSSDRLTLFEKVDSDFRASGIRVQSNYEATIRR